MTESDDRQGGRPLPRRLVAARSGSGEWHCQDKRRPTSFASGPSAERAFELVCRLAGLDPAAFVVVEQASGRVIYEERDAKG